MGKENFESVPAYRVPGTKFYHGVGIGYDTHLGEGETPEQALANAETNAQRKITAGLAKGREYAFSYGDPVPNFPSKSVDSNRIVVGVIDTGEKHDQQS